MTRLFESIRTQIEDLLFQWGQKENEYISTIQKLTEDKDLLNIQITELKQEIEFYQKQLEEVNLKLTQSEASIVLKKNNNKWRFFL